MTTVQQESRLPFIGEVLKYTPNQELVMRRSLNLSEDYFLEDHLFVNAKGVKPSSECLPVVPFTVSLEMMAEVAACHAPGYGLLSFEQISAQEWIQLDESIVSLDIVATVQPSNTPGTIVVSVKIFKEGKSKPAIKGTVVFGQNYQVSLNLSFSELQNPYDSQFLPEQIYQEGLLFHGPLFQVVGTRPRFGASGVTGDLLIRNKAQMFRSNPDPEMLTDPLLMDGVGQFIGLWAMERDWFVFPIGVEKIEFYRPTPPEGTLAPLRGEITQSNMRFLTSNIEVQDGAGGVWFRVKGWKKWIFHWEKKLVQFRRQPTQCFASEKVSFGETGESCSVHLVKKSDFVDLDIHILASNYLSQKEMDQFHSREIQSGCAQVWLMEIIAVKDVARELLSVTMETLDLVHPASFDVLENDSSYSVEGFPGQKVSIPTIHCLSTEDEAIAFVGLESLCLAIHSVDSKNKENQTMSLSNYEQSLLEPFSLEERKIWSQRIFCAKEAIMKSAVNMSTHISSLKVTHIGLHGEMECYAESEDVTYRINTFQKGNFVMAVFQGKGLQPEGETWQATLTKTVNGTL